MLGLNLSMGLWQGSKLLAWKSGSWSLSIDFCQWILISSAAWIPYFFLLLASTSTGSSEHKKPSWGFILMPIAFSILQFKEWIVYGAQWQDWGLFQQAGPLYWTFLLYYVLCFGYGLVLLLPKAWWNNPYLRSHQWSIGMAALLGIVLGSVDFANTLWAWKNPISNLAPLLFSLVLAWNMYRFELVERAYYWKKILVYFWGFLGLWAFLALSAHWWKGLFHQDLPLFALALLIPLSAALWKLILHRANPMGRIESEEWEIYQAWLGRIKDARTLLIGLKDLAETRGYRDFGAFYLYEGRWEHLGFAFAGAEADALGAAQGQIQLLHMRALHYSLRFGKGLKQEEEKSLQGLEFLKQWNSDIWLPLWHQNKLYGLIWMKDAPFVWKQFGREIKTLETSTASAAARLALFEALGEVHAKQRLAEIGFLTASLAHQVKNPLEGILGGMEMWKELGDPQMLEIVDHEAKKLSERIHLFLAWTKEIDVHWEEFDLRTWLIPLLPKEYNFIGCDPVLCWSDPQLLEQIVEVLSQNALRHAKGNGLQLNLIQGLGEIRLHFIDDGPGVAKPDELFQPFKTSHAQGHGLGLALAAKLASALHGQLRYQSRDPQGSEFILHLPQRSLA